MESETMEISGEETKQVSSSAIMESETMDISAEETNQVSSSAEMASAESAVPIKLDQNPFLSPIVVDLISKHSKKNELYSLRQVCELYHRITSKRCWDIHSKGFTVGAKFVIPPSDFPAHIFRELALFAPYKLKYRNTPTNPGKNFINRIAPFINEILVMINAAIYAHTEILEQFQSVKVLNFLVEEEQFLRENIGPILRALGNGLTEVQFLNPRDMMFDPTLQYVFDKMIQEFGYIQKIGLSGCRIQEARSLELLARNISRITGMGLALHRDDAVFPYPVLKDHLEILHPVIEVLGLTQPDEMRHVPWPILPIEGPNWQALKVILLTNWNTPLTFLRDFPQLKRIVLTDTNYATALFIDPELQDHENVINVLGSLPGPKKSLQLRHFDQGCGFHRFKNKDIVDFLNGNFDFTVWLSWFVEEMIVNAMEQVSDSD